MSKHVFASTWKRPAKRKPRTSESARAEAELRRLKREFFGVEAVPRRLASDELDQVLGEDTQLTITDSF